ncbi:uncharacterized protein [Miscanthus floridulus]|uniref:uncharacterized protein n=1 Tax=Miscanthus floridulus TaxID=154761 RepID=UPI00345AC2FB
MWMSEGFLGNGGPGDRRTRTQIEEDGLDYYEDLVIEPAPEIAGDGSECKMHDVIRFRSFAHEIAEEELLVVGPGQNSQLVSSSSAIRQLSVESIELSSSSVALPEWSSISSERHKLLRSLIINGRVKFDAPPTAGAAAAAVAGEPTLASFPSLRALLARHAETESKFGGELPRSFLELERLTSLKVDCTECTVPKGFGVLTGLRRLSLFPFPAQTDGDWCSLQELGQLQELVRLEIRGLAAVRWLRRPESTTRSSLSSCDFVSGLASQPNEPRNSGRRRRRSFPKLEFLRFDQLRQWEEWEWDEEEKQAQGNKDSIRRALRELVLWDLPCITSQELPFGEGAQRGQVPRQRIIRGLANLRGVSIELCPALEVLQDVPALDTMPWTDPTVYELPDYLGGSQAKRPSPLLQPGDNTSTRVGQLPDHAIWCMVFCILRKHYWPIVLMHSPVLT